MRVGLIIAIERELKAFLEKGKDIETFEVNHRTIYKTVINNNEIYAVMSGWGIIDASAATQLLITKYDVETVINFGVTGALDRTLKVSDLFVVIKTLNYDFDSSPIDNVKKYQYSEFEDEFIPLDKSLIGFVKKQFPDIKDAMVASGGRFIEEKKDKEFLGSLGCNICDMEIAAIARVCFLNQVKCLSIKCISDTFDGDGGDFNTNVEASARKAFEVILSLLNNL